MRLFAAVVPPLHVLEDLHRAVLAVPAQEQQEVPPTRSRGLFGRFGSGGARTATAPVEEPGDRLHDQLDVTVLEKMHLRVTGFGNVTLGDSVQLTEALRAQAATWHRPELRFTGATALEWPGDESVWAKLAGDLDGLGTIGRGVPQVVQRLGFFVDRRQFRPWLSVGTITGTTTAPYLERLVAALEAYQGPAWVQDSVSLMKRVPDEDDPDLYEELERLPLAVD